MNMTILRTHILLKKSSLTTNLFKKIVAVNLPAALFFTLKTHDHLFGI